MYVLLEFWQKKHGDPYYEPTIVVHDIEPEYCTDSPNRFAEYILNCVYNF